MARKNKRKRSGGFILPPPFAITLILASVLALSYLWLNGRCEALGQELKALEVKSAMLQRTYANEELKWSNLKSPQNIDRALRRHNLVMSWPSKDQIVRLSDWDRTRELSMGRANRTAPRAPFDKVVMND